MKKRGREDDEIVFGVDGTPNAFALALAKTPSGLHANLLDFFREKTSLPVSWPLRPLGLILNIRKKAKKLFNCSKLFLVVLTNLIWIYRTFLEECANRSVINSKSVFSLLNNALRIISLRFV